MPIEPNKWYNPPEIVALGIAPVVDSVFKVKRYVRAGVLPANLVGTRNGLRYYVKGETLITFLAKWEAGDFHN